MQLFVLLWDVNCVRDLGQIFYLAHTVHDSPLNFSINHILLVHISVHIQDQNFVWANKLNGGGQSFTIQLKKETPFCVSTLLDFCIYVFSKFKISRYNLLLWQKCFCNTGQMLGGNMYILCDNCQLNVFRRLNIKRVINNTHQQGNRQSPRSTTLSRSWQHWEKPASYRSPSPADSQWTSLQS